MFHFLLFHLLTIFFGWVGFTFSIPPCLTFLFTIFSSASLVYDSCRKLMVGCCVLEMDVCLDEYDGHDYQENFAQLLCSLSLSLFSLLFRTLFVVLLSLLVRSTPIAYLKTEKIQRKMRAEARFAGTWMMAYQPPCFCHFIIS